MLQLASEQNIKSVRQPNMVEGAIYGQGAHVIFQIERIRHICGVQDMTDTFNLKDYMSTLAINGTFHHVGLPDKPLPEWFTPVRVLRANELLCPQFPSVRLFVWTV
jgi:hypothetical protein